MNGFGWSFYGFFLAAAVWLAGYFLWMSRQPATPKRRREVEGR